MSTIGHESDVITVSGLKTSLQKLKTDHINGKVNNITFDSSTGKIQKTINGTTTDVVQVYQRSETYTKSEVNGLVSTPRQNYATVSATSSTTNVTSLLPATGSADTIYRVANWDGTQYNTAYYSEYAWNGSAYVLLEAKDVGIDDKPRQDSNNFVKSGGVYNALSETYQELDTVKEVVRVLRDDTLYVTDKNGNVITKIDNSGLSSVDFLYKSGSGMIPIVEIIEKILLSFYDNYKDFYISDKKGNIILKVDENGLYTFRVYDELKRKYCSVGDSITASSNQGKGYPYFLAKLKNLEWSDDETNNGNLLGYIKIVDGKEDEYIPLSEMPQVTEVFNNTYSQSSYKVYAIDGSNNYYRRIYKLANGGKALSGELSISCGDVRYWNADIITLMLGINDVSLINSTGNPYSLGTINDVAIGTNNYYLLGQNYTLSNAISAIPVADRKTGMRLCVRESNSSVVDYYYIGNNTDGFENTNNWKPWYFCSFYSFLKGAVERVFSENKQSDIYLLNYMQFAPNGYYDENTTYKNVLEAIKNVAEVYHIPFIDLYGKSGVNGFNYQSYFREGSPYNVHPNEFGHKKIAVNIAKNMIINIKKVQL